MKKSLLIKKSDMASSQNETKKPVLGSVWPMVIDKTVTPPVSFFNPDFTFYETTFCLFFYKTPRYPSPPHPGVIFFGTLWQPIIFGRGGHASLKMLHCKSKTQFVKQERNTPKQLRFWTFNARKASFHPKKMFFLTQLFEIWKLLIMWFLRLAGSEPGPPGAGLNHHAIRAKLSKSYHTKSSHKSCN